MYKVVILGCENSHADGFIKAYSGRDVEIIGVYSDDKDAEKRISDKYGVPIISSYDAAVGKVDGVIITARHGGLHYKYAKPYIESGVPMFIDKPISVDEEEAVEFMSELKRHSVRFSGGSSVVLTDCVTALKEAVKNGVKPIGGYVRAPINTDQRYGGFFFYSQHLTQVMCEIFGYYPDSVKMYEKGTLLTGVVRYKEFDVCIQFAEHDKVYAAVLSAKDGYYGGNYEFGDCFQKEYEEFYRLLRGGEQRVSYNDFIAPVFIMNAMKRAIDSGSEEFVNRCQSI